jgi:L-lactate dehydrogenase complex protein LldE
MQSVALFVTCLVDQLMPEVGVATVKLLRRAGFEVQFPQKQGCCGQPFYNSGFRKQAASLAKQTIQVLEVEPAVVLPSGSCTTMIRHEYPNLLEDDPEWLERARQIGSKCYELSEFLVHKAAWPTGELGAQTPNDEDDKRQQKAVTYHDSCHMCRRLGLRHEPRRLLLDAGYSLHEMNEPDRCCGFGGLFSLRLPEISTAMTADKVQRASITGAGTVVTADPGCLMQMRSLVVDGGPRIQHLGVALEEMTR